MQISRRTDVIDDHLVVGLSGDFDISAVSRVRSVFHEVVRDGWADVVVDMSEVGFVDSAALGTLIGLRRRCSEAGGSCVLVGSNDFVSRLVAMSQLDSVLHMADSNEHAATMIAANRAGNLT